MIAALATVAVLALGAPQQPDTTFAVRAGGTLEVDTNGGSVTVETWDRDAIRIETAGSRSRPRIAVRGGVVAVRSESMRAGPASADITITVPRRFGVRVDGVNVDVAISGTTGDVEIDNVEGSIRVSRVTGSVSVESVSGGIAIDDVRGSVTAMTVNQGIRMRNVRGDIDAETVNGGIMINGSESMNVRAGTVNGYVDYDGAVRDGGRYYLGAHNGRITMSLAENANARVTVDTNSGKIDTAFPVQINSLRDSRTQFTLGSGSATVELQSFNGTVYLVRPGR